MTCSIHGLEAPSFSKPAPVVAETPKETPKIEEKSASPPEKFSYLDSIKAADIPIFGYNSQYKYSPNGGEYRYKEHGFYAPGNQNWTGVADVSYTNFRAVYDIILKSMTEEHAKTYISICATKKYTTESGRLLGFLATDEMAGVLTAAVQFVGVSAISQANSLAYGIVIGNRIK